MLANPIGNIERLVSQLLLNDNYKAALEAGLLNYKIRSYGVVKLQPNFILVTYYQISNKFYFTQQRSYTEYWHQNELKIYIWLLVCYSFVKKRCISQMTDIDWLYFNEIFKLKSLMLLQYQGLLLLKRPEKHLKWTKDQISLLKNIKRSSIPQFSHIKNKKFWKEAAKNLYIKSQRKYFRTGKQCRQYWINHLDPIPTKLPWSLIQDINLIVWTYVQNKKWSKISKLFQGKRTQHMVKNRFNSLYRCQLKNFGALSHEKYREQYIMNKLRQKLQMKLEQQYKNIQLIITIEQPQNSPNQQQNISLQQIPNQSNNILPTQTILQKSKPTMHEYQFQSNQNQHKQTNNQQQLINNNIDMQNNNNTMEQLSKNTNSINKINNIYDDRDIWDQGQYSFINLIKNYAQNNNQQDNIDSIQFQFFQN